VNGHTHEVDLEVSLDFLNTLEYEDGFPVDHLGSPAEAVAWLAEHGVLHGEAAPSHETPSVHGRIRRVRRALREVTDALAEDRAADPDALETVNRTLRARETVILVPAPDGIGLDHRHEGDPIDSALARLTGPIVGEVRSGKTDRFRICANDGCRWVFYDSSRTARRRWCDMSTCGNRAKAARHRAKVRQSAS